MEGTYYLENFIKMIFGEVIDISKNLKNLLLMNVYEKTWGGTENPFYSFSTGAGLTIKDMLSTIAITMCGVFFCIEFVKTLSKVEGTTYEMVLSVGLKFCLARLAISLADSFVGALHVTSFSLILNASGAIETMDGWSSPTQFMAAISSGTYDLGTTETFIHLGILLIPAVGVKLIFMVTQILAWGRLLEIIMLRTLMPIPVGCLFIDNGRITKRYLASYFAVELQGLIMLIALSFFRSFVADDMKNIINTYGAHEGVTTPCPIVEVEKIAFKLLLGGIIMVIIMAKSGQWASKVVGEG